MSFKLQTIGFVKFMYNERREANQIRNLLNHIQLTNVFDCDLNRFYVCRELVLMMRITTRGSYEIKNDYSHFKRRNSFFS